MGPILPVRRAHGRARSDQRDRSGRPRL